MIIIYNYTQNICCYHWIYTWWMKFNILMQLRLILGLILNEMIIARSKRTTREVYWPVFRLDHEEYVCILHQYTGLLSLICKLNVIYCIDVFQTGWSINKHDTKDTWLSPKFGYVVKSKQLWTFYSNDPRVEMDARPVIEKGQFNEWRWMDSM